MGHPNDQEPRAFGKAEAASASAVFAIKSGIRKTDSRHLESAI